ncbi:adenylate kinase [Planctomycetota bacterium]
MRIVLLGAPGAGKGTQCKRIVDKYGLLHLSSGDILRRERAEETDLGKKAEEFMDSGGLVPDEIIVEIMAGAIEKAPETGFVLDGFPRTVNQAVELDKSLTSANKAIDIVLNLKISDHIVLERLTGRRSCPKCGAVYHIENLKPKAEGICDKDGTKLVQRPDDTTAVVSNRLKTFYEQTEPLADYYTNNCSIYEIDADKDADEITSLIFEKLDALVKA